jgi:leucyl-tRNA synthetase
MMFYDAVKFGFHDLLNARDNYLSYLATISRTNGLSISNSELLRRYIRLQLHLLAPICPHFSDFVWQEMLGNRQKSIMDNPWPTVSRVDVDDKNDAVCIKQWEYLERLVHDSRLAVATAAARHSARQTQNKQIQLQITVANGLPDWQHRANMELKVLWKNVNGQLFVIAF